MEEDIVYELDRLDGHGFEVAMLEVFRRLGYSTERGSITNDKGRDIIIQKGNETVVVECKHHRATIGRPVVQKLHSATTTYPGATGGIVVATSSFSNGARQYTDEISAGSAIWVQLWDYSKLAQEARRVGVYLVNAQQGMNLFFHAPCRDEMEVLAEITSRYIAGLESEPRSAYAAIKVQIARPEAVPVVAVDYEVSRSFTTQVGVIYKAAVRGRRLCPIRDRLNTSEDEFWRDSNLELLPSGVLQDKPAATYFGASINDYERATIHDIANQLSCHVRYRGRNNQTYSKFCEVRAKDVHATSKQVLLFRQKADLTVGPRHYAISFADDRTRSWAVSDSAGFVDGLEGFLNGTGILCNDCALISPSIGHQAGSRCAVCRRTLCKDHNWKWPKKIPRSWVPLCSECYRAKDPKADRLDSSMSFLRSVPLMFLLALVPGLPFLLGKRIVLGTLLLSVSLVFALYSGVLAFHYPEILLVGAILSIAASISWSMRLRRHARNLEQLRMYKRVWLQNNED